jgi:hypothetical protein
MIISKKKGERKVIIINILSEGGVVLIEKSIASWILAGRRLRVHSNTFRYYWY